MSDLIDKQTVIDALYDWREHSMTDAEAWHLKQVIFYIKCMPSLELPSAEPEQKWIPCSEALPNNEEYDWVLGQIRETDSGYLWIPRQVEYRKIKDDWYEDSIGWLKKNPDHAFEVIAWMPLPEKWRGDR